MNTDLFGQPIDVAVDPGAPDPVRKERPNGYAAAPGSGPKGETCRSCQHAVKSSRYWKCALIRHRWTHGYGTDIRLKTAACSFWEAHP